MIEREQLVKMLSESVCRLAAAVDLLGGDSGVFSGVAKAGSITVAIGVRGQAGRLAEILDEAEFTAGEKTLEGVISPAPVGGVH